MFTPWILCLITAAYSYDTKTITANLNTTTLYPTNKTIIRNVSEPKPSQKPTPQTWKLEATFAASNITEVEARNTSDSIEEEKGKEIKEEIKDFKPSQHLGSFFDDDAAEVIKTPIAGPVIKKPASGFVGSVINEQLPTFNKIPKHFYQTYKQFPYKYEDAIYTKARPNWQEEPLDSKPTVESPVKLPAGGLYKSSGTFKGKPNSDEVFGLDGSEEAKEHSIKRRNPWQHILRLATAFIPVGLIISALTPSVITIQNVDDNRDPPGIYRRSDTGGTDLAPISEQCRRRLLCELHSDRYYTPPTSSRRKKAKLCYKIHCEDTDALWRTLRWLFAYHQPGDGHKGRQIT